ncbi:MAG: transposase [Hyphomonadaceae bacterium]
MRVCIVDGAAVWVCAQRPAGGRPDFRASTAAHVAHRRSHGWALAEPLLFDGTCDTGVFNAWLKTRLCPRLNAHHLVIMDNAAFHTSPETAQLIAATGATLLFLAPYSPDLNPIEHDFAALKKRREYQEQATLDDIVRGYH